MTNHLYISPRQCRAARAWLGWTQNELAEKAGVFEATVTSFESGHRKTLRSSILALKVALTGAGFQFDEAGGICIPPGE